MTAPGAMIALGDARPAIFAEEHDADLLVSGRHYADGLCGFCD